MKRLSYVSSLLIVIVALSSCGQKRAVDLGLSVKWATCNVGANSPEEYGNYYAWGDTIEKRIYDIETYNYIVVSNDGARQDLQQNINSNICGTSNDVAHVKLGEGWRMPTMDEIKELCEKCSWKWTSVRGIEGYRVTGPNGRSIFLPAAGYCNNDNVNYRGWYGGYWSGVSDSSDSYSAHFLFFYRSGHDSSYGYRYAARTIRPVTE